MIRDADIEFTTATPLDLETQRPGPGQMLELSVNDVPAGNLAFTHSDTEGGAYTPLFTVVVPATKKVTATLPTSTKRWIRTTFASGSVSFVLRGSSQTAS